MALTAAPGSPSVLAFTHGRYPCRTVAVCAETSRSCAACSLRRLPGRSRRERAAPARPYARKVSGITRPSGANTEAFEAAVAEVTEVTTRLLAGLAPRRQPPKTVPPLRRPEVRARLKAAAVTSATPVTA